MWVDNIAVVSSADNRHATSEKRIAPSVSMIAPYNLKPDKKE